MAAPTFTRPIQGTAPNQFVENTADVAALNAVLLDLWHAIVNGADEQVIADLVTTLSGLRSAAQTAEAGAVTAQGLAEAARDAAFVSADVFADIATGRAAVADGEQFQVVTGDEIIRYRRDSSTTQTEVARYPAARAVFRPVWAGAQSGWPDPVFRQFDLGVDFWGRSRWSNPGAMTHEPSPSFPGGRVLRKLQSSSSAIQRAGIRIYLDDIKAAPGDTITLRCLLTGTSAVSTAVRVGRQWLNAAGAQISVATTSAGPVSPTDLSLWTQEVEAPANAASVVLYAYINSGAAETYVDMHAAWATKGTAAQSPEWPTVLAGTLGRDRFVQGRLDFLDQERESQTDILAYAFESRGDVEADSETVSLAVTSPQLNQAYDLPFTGWGETYTPSDVSFNAVRVRTVGREPATDSTAFWRTLGVVVRTGDDPHLGAATLVAVGETLVNPATDVLEDVTIILRDPSTGAVKTLTDADFEDEEYFIGVYARNANGGAAAMSPHRAVQANSLGQSYFSTTSTGLPGSFSTFTSNWRLGVDHLLLDDPVDVTVYSPTADLKADIGGGNGASAARDAFFGRLPNYDARLARGQSIVVAMIGDSWVNDERRGMAALRTRFAAALGVSGAGYVSANTDNVRTPPQVSRSRSGTWTDVRTSGGIGPEAAHAVSSDVGAQLVITPAQTVDRYVIHYLQRPDGGSFSYRFGAGSPTTISTDGALEYIAASVSGSGALTIEITAAGSEGVTLAGVDCRNDTAGDVVVHKLGNSGARIDRFLAVPQAYAIAAYAALEIDVAVLEFATNEQASNVTPSTFRANLEALADRVLAARPQVDILLAPTGPNDRSDAFETSAYADAAYSLAVERGWAFADANRIFGTFADADARGLYADGVHPNEDGGAVKSRAWWREFLAP